jgi:KDO2-lipid IV(A) lauroyltransferase
VYLYPYECAPRKILEALKRKEMTGFLLDFGVTHHLDITTVPIRFFGTTTPFPAGPAQLALLTGAPIVVGHTQVMEDGKIHVYATAPIVAQKSGDRNRDMTVVMQEIASRFESFIRRHPEQWYMFRPMWRTKVESRFKVARKNPEPRGS